MNNKFRKIKSNFFFQETHTSIAMNLDCGMKKLIMKSAPHFWWVLSHSFSKIFRLRDQKLTNSLSHCTVCIKTRSLLSSLLIWMIFRENVTCTQTSWFHGISDKSHIFTKTLWNKNVTHNWKIFNGISKPHSPWKLRNSMKSNVFVMM